MTGPANAGPAATAAAIRALVTSAFDIRFRIFMRSSRMACARGRLVLVARLERTPARRVSANRSVQEDLAHDLMAVAGGTTEIVRGGPREGPTRELIRRNVAVGVFRASGHRERRVEAAASGRRVEHDLEVVEASFEELVAI